MALTFSPENQSSFAYCGAIFIAILFLERGENLALKNLIDLTVAGRCNSNPMDKGSSNPPAIEIFSSFFCPYCHNAIHLLRKNNLPFKKIEIPMILGWKPPTARFREMVRRSGGLRTVPQIFVNGEYFGDDDTLEASERDGTLKNILSNL